MSRRAKLEIVTKPDAAPEMPPKRHEVVDKFTLRTPRSVTRQLRQLCIKREYESGIKVSQSDLIREAINDLFERNGMLPLA